MKFNAVVGNPPYQEEGISTRKTPIYHLFYDIAFKLSSKVTLITPGRFLFRAGQTPKDWTEKILSDKHFKVIKYYHKSSDIFPNVDIKGGVVIAYRDSERDFGKINFFSEYPKLATILRKIQDGADLKNTSFASIVAPQGAYRFTELFFQSCLRALSVQGKGTAYKITSNSLEKLPEVFLEFPLENRENYIQIMGRCKGSRVIRWIKKTYVQADNSLRYYKVFIAEANGTGRLGEVLSSPIIGTPMVGSTDTFLSVGCFQTPTEAENCRKYICTKFARALLGTLKATQHNPRDTWSNVPLQDFSDKSDINWDCSIAEIDSQLYRKYGIKEDEIVFIESNVKPMTLKKQTNNDLPLGCHKPSRRTNVHHGVEPRSLRPLS